MLLVVTYAGMVGRALRDAWRSHEEPVDQRIGGAARVKDTAFGAVLAPRLRTEDGADVRVERTAPRDVGRRVAGGDVREVVRATATTGADHDEKNTPDATFTARQDHPDPATTRVGER